MDYHGDSKKKKKKKSQVSNLHSKIQRPKKLLQEKIAKNVFQGATFSLS